MVMARGKLDSGKERFWRDMVERWRGSKLTIRAFCDEQGVSEASFYSWRRTIAQRERQTAFTPVVRGKRVDDPPIFVPLRVAPVPTAATSALEVVVGPGRVIRVPPGFDAATLRNLLAVLEEAPPC
jgi:hypothetical protein